MMRRVHVAMQLLMQLLKTCNQWLVATRIVTFW